MTEVDTVGRDEFIPALMHTEHAPHISFTADLALDQPITTGFHLSANAIDAFPDYNFTDMMFLEDALLANLPRNPVELATPPRLTDHSSMQLPSQSVSAPDVTCQCLQDSGNGIHTMSPDLQSMTTDISFTPRGLRITQDDVDAFIQDVNSLGIQDLHGRFLMPSKSRVARLLNAYFEFFDPHTPIVHQSTYRIAGSAGQCPSKTSLQCIARVYI